MRLNTEIWIAEFDRNFCCRRCWRHSGNTFSFGSINTLRQFSYNWNKQNCVWFKLFSFLDFCIMLPKVAKWFEESEKNWTWHHVKTVSILMTNRGKIETMTMLELKPTIFGCWKAHKQCVPDAETASNIKTSGSVAERSFNIPIDLA